jgi:phosphoglycerol transferase MdoB-like AlkP superfamily enzyme
MVDAELPSGAVLRRGVAALGPTTMAASIAFVLLSVELTGAARQSTPWPQFLLFGVGLSVAGFLTYWSDRDERYDALARWFALSAALLLSLAVVAFLGQFGGGGSVPL